MTKEKPERLGDDSPCSILSVQPQQGRCRRKMVCLQIAPNGGQPPTQFLPVESLASVAETAEPVGTVGLRDNGARTDDLPALAPRVARSTHLVQATLWCRQLLCLWQSALPGGFPRPIDVKDHTFFARSINKSADLALLAQGGEPADRRETGSAGLRQVPGSKHSESARVSSARASSGARRGP